jgi:hypothetical protein
LPYSSGAVGRKALADLVNYPDLGRDAIAVDPTGQYNILDLSW